MENNKENIIGFLKEGMFLTEHNVNSNDESKRDGLKQQIIEEFIAHKEEETILQKRVARADDKGNLYLDLGIMGLTGMVLNEEVEGHKYEPERRSRWVGLMCNIVVIDIDKEKGIIYFSRSRARKQAKEILRSELIRAIKAKEKPVLKAKVTNISDKTGRILIDIAGLELLGYIPVSEWEHKFTYDIKKEVDLYEVVDVVPLRYFPPRKDIGEAFLCSRKDALPNPWIGIEEKVPKGSILDVKCKSLEKNKWFATLPDLGIELFCHYPDPKPDDSEIIIKLGHRYKVKVYKSNEKEKQLRARVIAEINN
jgi:small subunit ribosomal protein S1